MGEEEAQPEATPEIEDYLKVGIQACKETALEAGIDSEGLKKETKKCSIEWLKGEEYNRENAFISKAQEVFAEKFDELYGEEPAKEQPAEEESE